MVSWNFTNFTTVGIMAVIFWALVHWLMKILGVTMPGFDEPAMA